MSESCEDKVSNLLAKIHHIKSFGLEDYDRDVIIDLLCDAIEAQQKEVKRLEDMLDADS